MFGDIALCVVLSLCALVAWKVWVWALRSPPAPSESPLAGFEALSTPRNVRLLDPKDEKFAEILARARRDLYDQEGEITSASDAMDWIKELRGRLAEGDR